MAFADVPDSGHPHRTGTRTDVKEETTAWATNHSSTIATPIAFVALTFVGEDPPRAEAQKPTRILTIHGEGGAVPAPWTKGSIDSAFLLADDATVRVRGASKVSQEIERHNREDLLNRLRTYAEAGR